MSVELFTVDYILATFLIFVRVSSMIMTAPFFSSAAFPRQVKIFFSLITAFLLSFAIPAESVFTFSESETFYFVTAIILEILVGAALGLVGQLVFAGITMGGQLISLKITLSFAQVVNSMTQQKSDLVGNLFTMFAILVFLAIGGEKIYLNALAQSFELIPVNLAQIAHAGPFMLKVAKYLFIIGVQIAAPFLVVLFIIDLALAIFARIMPQANILFIAIPVKLGLGFILLLSVLPYLPDAFEIIFSRMFGFFRELMGIIGP